MNTKADERASALAQLQKLQAQVMQADAAAREARARRDEAIRAALESETLSGYAVAKALGLSEMAVSKIKNVT